METTGAHRQFEAQPEEPSNEFSKEEIRVVLDAWKGAGYFPVSYDGSEQSLEQAAREFLATSARAQEKKVSPEETKRHAIDLIKQWQGFSDEIPAERIDSTASNPNYKVRNGPLLMLTYAIERALEGGLLSESVSHAAKEFLGRRVANPEFSSQLKTKQEIEEENAIAAEVLSELTKQANQN